MVDSIKVQKILFDEKFEKLLNIISKFGEDWYKEIDIVIKREKIKVNIMKIKCMYVLDKQEGEIN